MSQAAIAVVVFLSQLLFAELPHNGMSLTADEESDERVEGAEVEEGEEEVAEEEVAEGEDAAEGDEEAQQPLMPKCGEVITVHIKGGGARQVQVLCEDSRPSGDGPSHTASAPEEEP